MSALLFLAHRIPFPPDKGDKIRAYQMLRHLAGRHEIYLGTFVDDPRDWQHVDHIRALCRDAYFAPLPRRRLLARGALGVLRGAAVTEWGYRDRGLRAWVRNVARTARPRAAFAFSSAMGQYAMEATPRPERVAVDFVDVDSDKWAQYAGTARWPMSALYRREARRLLAYDRRLAMAADASLLVSEAEAALFASLVPEARERVHAVPNGVDTAYFDPGAEIAPLALAGRPALVFTGAMDYRPNADAVCWFADAVLPGLLARHPHLCFSIVGANPTAEVTALGRRQGIAVTGRVADVRPYLAAADAVVAPMRLARGIQNKVLEGMAMAKPVITTPQGLEGLAARDGQHLLVAADADGYVSAVDRALVPRVRDRLGHAARRFVVEHHSWAAGLARLDAVLDAP